MTSPSPPLSDRLAGVLLAMLALALCAACVGYLAVRWVVWPGLDRWRPEILAEAGRRLGRPVSADALRPSWDGLHPALEVEHLRVDGDDGAPRLAVGRASAKVSWRSLVQGELRFASLRLESPRVVVERLAPGRVAVAGVELPSDGASGDGRGLDWLLRQGELVARGASVAFVDRSGERAPQSVDGVDAVLRTVGRRHQAGLSVGRPGDATRTLSLQAEIYRAPLSRPSDWRQWRGEAHLSVHELELAPLLDAAAAYGLAPPPVLAGAAGRLDALAWLRLESGRLVDATLKLRADAPALALPEGRLALGGLAAEARVERPRDGGLAVRVVDLTATDAAGFSAAADGAVEIGFDAGGALRSVSATLARFDAAAALAAARRLPLPEALAARLRLAEVAGTIDALSLRWARADARAPEPRAADRAAGRAPRLELSVGFEGLSLRVAPDAQGRVSPSFENLSGRLRATDREGELDLAGRRTVLRMPGWFDDPVRPFERIDGRVTWMADPSLGDAWLHVEVPRLEWADADMRGTASGRWTSGGKGRGLIDVAGRVGRVDARRALRWIPNVAGRGVRDWLDSALVAGTADEVALELRGDLHDFPFRAPGEGRFRIGARLRDATFGPAPGWPRFEQTRAELAIVGPSVEVRAPGAAWRGLRLADVQVRMADWREGVLSAEGRAAGPAADMLRFVADSPVDGAVSAFTRDLRVGGDARLALRLTLPLRDAAHPRIAGQVELAGNDVTVDRTLPEFRAVTGRVEFTEQGVSIPEARATFLGGPIRVEGRPAGEGRMRVEASGAIDANGVRSLADNALTRRLDGRTEYRAVVEVDRRASTLRLESDLVGLSSTLPEPFAKPAGTRLPLRVSSTPTAPPARSARPPGDRLDVRVGDGVALVIERDRDPRTERLVVARGGFAVGAEPVLRESGLSALVHARALDVDAWRALLDDGELERLERDARAGGGPGGMSWIPELVSMTVDDLRAGGRDLHEVVLGASRLDGLWRANVASREVQGHFEWRDARPGERIGTLTARFGRLELARTREGEVEAMLSAPPARLPALDVRADELVLGGVPVGRLQLSATNGGTAAQPVWRLDRLVIVNPAARLEASGTWSFVASRPPSSVRPGAPTASLAPPSSAALDGAAPGGDPRSTALQFDLEVADAGALLGRFGLRDTMRGGTGSLSGSLAWNGSPLAIDYPTLDGAMKVAMGKGEFLKVDPGIAKLIGVINMQSLPRRLAGDFRDLFAEGFAFDAIGGDLRVAAGIARTDGLRMRGVQAQVHIRGEADLRHETQTLQVEVRPELNAGLASLALGAINPVIGLGSFAAQYALRRPLQEVLAYEVDVTGSWSDPVVSERNRRLAPPRTESEGEFR